MNSGVQGTPWRVETEKEWGLRLNDYLEALLQSGLISRRLTPREQGLGGRWRKIKPGGQENWVWRVPRRKGGRGKGETQLTICVLRLRRPDKVSGGLPCNIS